MTAHRQAFRLICFLFWPFFSEGYLISSPADLSNCRSASSYGQLKCCPVPADDACNYGGKFGSFCGDLAGNPKLCSSTEEFFGVDLVEKSTGEFCAIGSGPDGKPANLFYNHVFYEWKCCGCPKGFKPVGTQGSNCKTIPLVCYGCSDPAETLTQIPTGEWTCCLPASKQPGAAACTGNAYKNNQACPASCRSPPSSATISNCCKPPASSPTAGKCGLDSTGESFLKGEEGWCSEFYSAGDGKKTIGWGHTCEGFPGSCNNFKAPLDYCTGNTRFWDDVSAFIGYYLKGLPNVNTLNQNQFNALVSVAYNCGGKDFVSGGVIKTAMAAGKLSEICDDILQSCKDKKGQTINPDRRQRESDLCKTPSNPLNCHF